MIQAELEKGIKAGLARIAELEQRAAAVAEAGGDVDGEDPVRENQKQKLAKAGFCRGRCRFLSKFSCVFLRP